MAQEPSITSPSSSQTLETLITSNSTDSSNNPNPSLTRNVSSSRLNAKAPEFVPRIGTVAGATSGGDPRLVISPPPTSPGIIHVYPSPNSPFHSPIGVNVPVSVPVNVQNHHGHHHHGHHHQHHVPVQYHHHNQHHQHHNHQRQYNGGGTGFMEPKDVAVQVQKTGHGDPELKDGLTDEATQKIVNQAGLYFPIYNSIFLLYICLFIPD